MLKKYAKEVEKRRFRLKEESATFEIVVLQKYINGEKENGS
jgi:hypothetical protein